MGNKKNKKSWAREFFSDSRGNLSVFTICSLLACCVIFFSVIIEVINKHFIQTELMYSLFVIYCLSVLGDNLIAALIERGNWKPQSPDTQVIAPVTTDNLTVNQNGAAPQPPQFKVEDEEEIEDLNKVD